MNCEAVRELLWAYLEKETTAEEAEKIEKHLKECTDCREEMELQKEMMETLAGLPDEELPEGYHAELMRKLQAEAAPNVVPFPVRKKKQPMYKQWGMIAAAVLVVVAAGGMNGMLEMRESQNAAVEEMKIKDAAMPEMASDDGVVVYDEIADVTEEVTVDLDPSEITTYSSKKMNEPAAGAATADIAAVPEVASVEETNKEFSVTRMTQAEATDQAVLLVSDSAVAMAELQKAIAEAEGFEENAEEGSIAAVIPVENFSDFVKVVEEIGTLEWTQKGNLEEGAAYHTVKIQLKNN